MLEKLFRMIAPSRLMLYGAVLALLPFLFLLLHFTAKVNKIESISTHLEQTTLLYLQKEQRQAINKACRKYYAKKEKYALERALEKLCLLKKEREEIEKVMAKGSFFGNRPLEERLSFLKGKENRIVFQEGNATAKMGIQEVLETLVHPVEIDTSDLKEILALIEGNHPLFPQAIIVDFHMKRVVKESENEVFVCNIKLLKREYL